MVDDAGCVMLPDLEAKHCHTAAKVDEEESTRGLNAWRASLESHPSGVRFRHCREQLWRDIHRVVDDQLLLPARVVPLALELGSSAVELVPLAALHLLVLTEMAVIGASNSQAALAATQLSLKVKSIRSDKTKDMIALYLMTRAPLLSKWLAASVTLAIDAYDACPEVTQQAQRALSAIWILISGILVNAYSLDVRVLLCEEPTLLRGLVRVAFTSAMSVSASADGWSYESHMLLQLVDIFATSPFWCKFVEEPQHQHISRRVIEHLLAEAAERSIAGDCDAEALVSVLKCIAIFAVCSEAFASALSTNASLYSPVINLITAYADAPLEVLARSNLNWLLGHTVAPTEATAGEDNLQINHGVICSGLCISLLDLIGRTTSGAAAMKGNGVELLRAVKLLSVRHGEEALRAFGLWPATVGLLPTIILGNVTDPAHSCLPAQRSRLKHYNLLVPCSYCSKTSVGSRQLKICGGCHLARYCGRECQQLDWQKSHNALCMQHPGAALPAAYLTKRNQQAE